MTKEKNIALIEKYPFLLPRDRWSDEVPDDYDYSYTELDSMPEGWRKAFGEDMCEAIKQALIKDQYPIEEYRIANIKEKFGELRWQDFGSTEEIENVILNEYAKKSRLTCIKCGAPAFGVTRCSTLPYCEMCGSEAQERIVPLKEFYEPTWLIESEE